jgi:hypothetical protein
MSTTVKRRGSSGIGLLGCLVFVALVVNWAWKYGREWEFGRFVMPNSLVAPDGLHYRSGAEIDPVSLAIIRSGKEEEHWLAALGILACLIAWASIAVRRCYRKQAAIAALNVLMAEIQALQARGELAAAGHKLRIFEREYPRAFKTPLPAARLSNGQ